MPTPKEMEELAAAAGRDVPAKRAGSPAGEMSPEYWEAVLKDALADDRPKPAATSVRSLQLYEIPQNVLRVSCNRCGRTLEIQKADATRLYGASAAWMDVGQRLLNDTCQRRTGRYEEDGCWPSFE
jgi:hypothetical protein